MKLKRSEKVRHSDSSSLFNVLQKKKKKERKRKETYKLKNPYAKVLDLTSCIASKT